MKILRSLLARLVITIGVLVLGLWLSARFIIQSVEDGTVISGLASTALNLGSTQSKIAEQAQSSIDSQLTAQGIDPTAPGIQTELSEGIAAAVASDEFIDAVIDLIREAEDSLVAQLTDDSLPLTPLTLTLNISEPLYAALATNPQLVDLIPASAVEPVPIPILEEENVEKFRGGYDWVERVNTWGLWIALGLLGIGFLLIRKKRWILPKLFLGAGLFVLGLWALARWLDAEKIVGWLPEDADESTRSAIRDLIPQETIDNAEASLLKWAIVLLVISAVLYVFVWWLFHKLKARSEGEPEGQPEREPVSVSASRETSGETGLAMETEPAGVKPQGARSSGNQSPRFDDEDPVFSGETVVGEEPMEPMVPGESIADHPEPGSTPRKPELPKGPIA